jgi:hypothetical protein
MGPRNKKRPLTLSSLGTPEQPSPRTAQAQDTVLPGRCKFHLRASAWHKTATLGLPDARLWNTFSRNWCIVSLCRKGVIQVCRSLHSGAPTRFSEYSVRCFYSITLGLFYFGSRHAIMKVGSIRSLAWI